MRENINNTRVTILAPYSVFPAQTGGKRFIALFYEYLAKTLPVEFIGVDENVIPDFAKEPFHKALGSSKLRYVNPALFLRLKKIIYQQKITDLIIVHPYFGWLAIMLARLTGVKIAMLSHNIESERFKSMGKWWWKIMWRYEKKVHQCLNHNFFVTEEDRQYAIKHYKLAPEKCFVITYGIEWNELPVADKRNAAGRELRQMHNIDTGSKILLFNGSLDYQPNIEAVNYIIENINPLLKKEKEYSYKIIICGKGLPASYNNLEKYKEENIIYAGFVEDINLYFLGADVFLNPVISGGGIKTKLVEALGNNLYAVSCKTGAYGVPQKLTNDKLTVTEDYDWIDFVKNITTEIPLSNIPKEFFEHFYWGAIAEKAANILQR